MEALEHGRALTAQTGLLADTAAGVDLSAPVPTCPGWTMLQLFRHVGRGHRWAATMARTGAFVEPREVPGGRPPDDDVSGWLRQSAQEMLDAAAEVGADTPVWTSLGPRPVQWWVRRRLHETTVHRADVALAAGLPYALAPELAVDALDEWLDLLAQGRSADGLAGLDPGVTLHLHATDAPGEWLVHGGQPLITWEHGHAKATTAVRGRTQDLLLAALRRSDADSVELLGDAAVWWTWLERTTF